MFSHVGKTQCHTRYYEEISLHKFILVGSSTHTNMNGKKRNNNYQTTTFQHCFSCGVQITDCFNFSSAQDRMKGDNSSLYFKANKQRNKQTNSSLDESRWFFPVKLQQEYVTSAQV